MLTGKILETHFLGRPARLAGVLAVLLSFGFPLRAQVGRSGISGTVVDQSRAAVPNVKIGITNEATNVESSTTSTASGDYTVLNLPIGRYTVTAEAPGFQKAVYAHVATEVDKIVSLDVQLTVGGVTQTMQVTAAPSLVTTTSATVGNLVTSAQIQGLPLNGRSWISLNYLTPGALTFGGASNAYSDATKTIAPGNVEVNNLGGGSNLVLIDGVAVSNTEDNVIGLLPSLDALQEFRTESSNPSAEYFGGAGAIITASTKSGTNTLHGSAFDFLRNSVFDARNFFSAAVPELHRNQFGASLGGPIKKDRTFFFFAWEGFAQVQAAEFVGDFPTALERTGNVSDLVPAGTTVVDPITGIPFTGNVIPTGRLNSVTTDWMNSSIGGHPTTPLPNYPVPPGQGDFRAPANKPVDYDTYDGRVDQIFSEKSSFFGRYMYTNTFAGNPTYPQFVLKNQNVYSHNATAQYTRSFSPRFVFQGRLGFNRYYDSEATGNTAHANMEQAEGLVPGAAYFDSSPDVVENPPCMTPSGFSDFGGCGYRPRQIYNNDFHGEGLLFIQLGSHVLHAGGIVERNYANFPEGIVGSGSFNYTGAFSGLGLADFLLGDPRTAEAGAGVFHQNMRKLSGGGYVQDDWKVTPRFTLNLGVRLDEEGRYKSVHGTFSNYNLSQAPTAVLVTPANPPSGWGPSLLGGSETLPAPRVGLAWRTKGDTVVRAGYGIYYEPILEDPTVDMSINPPWTSLIINTYDISNLPTLNMANPLLGINPSAVGVFISPPNLQNPYTQQWNVNVERQFGGTLLSLGYVGNAGRHLLWVGDINKASPGPGPIQPRRPWNNIGGSQYDGGGRNSNYDGLQLKVQRRVASGLSVTGSYVWSKSMSDTKGLPMESEIQQSGYEQDLNRKAERALSEYDAPSILNVGYLYSLPFGRGRPFLNNPSGIAKAITGWQFGGLTRISSGTPWTVTDNFDNLNNGGTRYPDRICNPAISGSRSNGAKQAMWFNTSCFVSAPMYVYGNAGREPIRRPGLDNWDMSLQKEGTLTERFRITFRAEAFNIFNRVNFSEPNSTLNTPEFGTITSTATDSRELQFGLRVSF